MKDYSRGLQHHGKLIKEINEDRQQTYRRRNCQLPVRRELGTWRRHHARRAWRADRGIVSDCEGVRPRKGLHGSGQHEEALAVGL